MTHVVHDDFAAFLGIDWADAQHAVGLQAAGSAQRASCMLEHAPETIDAWVSRRGTRCTGQPLAICLARNKGPLVSALRTYDFLILFPLHPLPLARYRDACPPRSAKDAPTAAALQRELLLTQRDTLRPLKPQSPAMRARAQLVAPRRCVVNDHVRRTNRLTSALKHYFPPVLPWFPETETVLFGDFLQRWPTLNAAPLARRSPLETFCRDHPVRAADVLDKRIRALKAALPLTTDEGGQRPSARTYGPSRPRLPHATCC